MLLILKLYAMKLFPSIGKISGFYNTFLINSLFSHTELFIDPTLVQIIRIVWVGHIVSFIDIRDLLLFTIVDLDETKQITV